MTFISKTTAKIQQLAIIIIFMGLSACSAGPVPYEAGLPADESLLDHWLEDTLIPYLLRQIGQHPRFKGQPVLLVSMQGEEVRPRIDDLTDQIRGKIIDALLKEPGLDLVWRPTGRLRLHQQSIKDVLCDDYRRVHYYIGLDCGLTRLERKLYVKVRALNLAEQKWVSGFGKSWEGRPTAEQLAALAREHPDEYLRGLRPLPFSDDQPDLLALYLARNLSCLLRQAASEDLVVHVAKPSLNAPAVLKTILDLVEKYLARFQEVEVTDDPNAANVILVSEIHAIHQGLHQIWVSARYRHDETYVPGAETEAYMMIDSREQPHVADTQGERPAAPLPHVQHLATSSELLASFDLLIPLNQRLCSTGSPWQSGVRRLEPHGSLSTGSCLAVEMTLAAPAYVFLMGQDADGELTQMFPSACAGMQKNDIRLHPGQRLQFPSPSDPTAGVLELDGSPGMERVFAIAMTRREMADKFAYRLAEIQGLCRPGKKFPDFLLAGSPRRSAERVYQWQDYLNRLSAANPGSVQWRKISFWHVSR
ncbi:MAG: DUF4384 domain-containing protein [Desulfobacterales bacterium]|nr:MAG: DUF4384 domain-containing protein [Desulfobacterales bacterium]